MMFNPDFLPESADPQLSTRFENVVIQHTQIYDDFEHTEFFDMIEMQNYFIVADYSPRFQSSETKVFKGTVLKESNGTYSWFKNIKQGD